MGLPNVAYFSMEIAIDQSIPTYSGGLGFLAGSHMLSAGYLQMPIVGVTMLWSYGYYNQRIDHDGNVEVAYIRKHFDFLTDINESVEVDVYGEKVKVKAYRLEPGIFETCPVYYLTTDIEENSEWARSISHKLYDGNEKIRIAQETVLGIAGIRLLQKIGYKFDCVHLNEGHALPAAFELLNQYNGDLNKVKEKVVFTTHTPVAAGNEVHWIDNLLKGGFFAGCSRETAIQLGGEQFSLTVAALRMSRLANAVSQLHGLVSNKMWNWVEGRCPIRAITNAVNLHYWQDSRMKTDNLEALLDAKKEMKKEVFEYIANTVGKRFDPNVLTITWARRFADYKRAWLIFMDEQRILKLLNENKIQLIFAGKFHPDDVIGKEMFNKILRSSYSMKNVVVLTGYELDLSGKLKRASDIWLNTPLRPFEASGTSGMSANANGALHLSTFDGWTVEGTFPGINGYTIEYPGLDDNIPWDERHRKDYECMMDIIENQIIPTYYDEDKTKWAIMMRQAIRTAESYFNSDRMVVEYYNRLYKPIAHAQDEGGVSNQDYHAATKPPADDAWTFSNIK